MCVCVCVCVCVCFSEVWAEFRANNKKEKKNHRANQSNSEINKNTIKPIFLLESFKTIYRYHFNLITTNFRDIWCLFSIFKTKFISV